MTSEHVCEPYQQLSMPAKCDTYWDTPMHLLLEFRLPTRFDADKPIFQLSCGDALRQLECEHPTNNANDSFRLRSYPIHPCCEEAFRTLDRKLSGLLRRQEVIDIY
jgi:hypothetical protein